MDASGLYGLIYEISDNLVRRPPFLLQNLLTINVLEFLFISKAVYAAFFKEMRYSRGNFHNSIKLSSLVLFISRTRHTQVKAVFQSAHVSERAFYLRLKVEKFQVSSVEVELGMSWYDYDS